MSQTGLKTVDLDLDLLKTVDLDLDLQGQSGVETIKFCVIPCECNNF